MMGWRTKLKGVGEEDAFSDWRRYLCYLSRPGVTKWIKRNHNRRFRKQEMQRLRKFI